MSSRGAQYPSQYSKQYSTVQYPSQARNYANTKQILSDARQTSLHPSSTEPRLPVATRRVDDYEYYYDDDYEYSDDSYDEEEFSILRRKGEEQSGNRKLNKEKVSESGNNTQQTFCQITYTT